MVPTSCPIGRPTGVVEEVRVADVRRGREEADGIPHDAARLYSGHKESGQLCHRSTTARAWIDPTMDTTHHASPLTTP